MLVAERLEQYGPRLPDILKQIVQDMAGEVAGDVLADVSKLLTNHLTTRFAFCCRLSRKRL